MKARRCDSEKKTAEWSGPGAEGYNRCCPGSFLGYKAAQEFELIFAEKMPAWATPKRLKPKFGDLISVKCTPSCRRKPASRKVAQPTGFRLSPE